MAAIYGNYDVTARHHSSLLTSKETYLDALSVPSASLLNLLHLQSSGGGRGCFIFFLGGGESASYLAPGPKNQKKKKQQQQQDLNRVKTNKEMGKDLQNLTTIDGFTTVFLQALTCVRLTKTTRCC